MAEPSGRVNIGKTCLVLNLKARSNKFAEIIEHRVSEDGLKEEYYVHYCGYDRRLDNWIPAEHLDINVSPPEPKPEKEVSPGRRKRKSDSNGGAYRHQHHRGAQSMDPTLFAILEAEREEVTKMKNIPCIQLGRWQIDSWYYSPFPERCHGKKLYICEYTLKYMINLSTWVKQRKECTARAPPGKQIYSDGKLGLWEVDGCDQEVFCQNLCLLSKLFLDHKTLYYDPKPFLFYVLTEYREDSSDDFAGGGHQLLGYFSKEKYSVEDYNLACILTFPPYQRRGFGKLLISFSYELTKREGKVGSPEKPLSDLGKLSYRSYWTYILLTMLSKYDGQWSINELSSMTGIRIEDVISTLQALDLIRYWKGQHIVYVAPKLLAEQLSKMRAPRLCDASKLTWIPPPKAVVSPKTSSRASSRSSKSSKSPKGARSPKASKSPSSPPTSSSSIPQQQPFPSSTSSTVIDISSNSGSGRV